MVLTGDPPAAVFREPQCLWGLTTCHICAVSNSPHPLPRGVLLKHRFLDKCKFLWCPLRTGLWTPFLPHHPHFPPHSSFSTRLRPGSALGDRSSCFVPQSPWTRSILPGVKPCLTLDHNINTPTWDGSVHGSNAQLAVLSWSMPKTVTHVLPVTMATSDNSSWPSQGFHTFCSLCL